MVQHDQISVQPAPQCLDHVHLIPPQSKSRLLLAKSAVLEWTASELATIVKSAEVQIRGKIPKGARMKESLNHRDLHGIGTLTSSRFLTSMLAMLTSHMNGQEVGLLLGNQLLSSLQVNWRRFQNYLNSQYRICVAHTSPAYYTWHFVEVRFSQISTISAEIKAMFTNLLSIHTSKESISEMESNLN